ncbi:MAG TPA: osmoprotectant NAGGN system M42 family peptidase [Acidimicrobiales bacterium]|nr:osmoprotectant NAGGN system M42 family peptidase [Acidimicrobiales bacterium]
MRDVAGPRIPPHRTNDHLTPVPVAGGLPEVDIEWTVDLLMQMLRTPSPSGRTDAVMQLLGDALVDLPLELAVTRRGSLLATLPGRLSEGSRAIVAHADTIGCMVRALKPNGRLAVVPVGTHSARFAEGCRVTILTDDPDRIYVGTILPLLASGHAFGDEVDEQPAGWEHVEVRVDERCRDANDLAALGIRVGDFVALDSLPIVTESGYIVGRHLDGKAGVAAALGAIHALTQAGAELPHPVHLLITIAEEIGQGASHGLREDVAEMVSIDNAVCAPGNHSIEDGVTIPMADMTGPFDYHLTRNLCALCETHGIPYARDIFRFYRSDVAAALEAGAETRAALVAFGLDASHGAERTHVESLAAVANLMCAYLMSPLTFARWDREPQGDLRDFPSDSQPAPTERFGELPVD